MKSLHVVQKVSSIWDRLKQYEVVEALNLLPTTDDLQMGRLALMTQTSRQNFITILLSMCKHVCADIVIVYLTELYNTLTPSLLPSLVIIRVVTEGKNLLINLTALFEELYFSSRVSMKFLFSFSFMLIMTLAISAAWCISICQSHKSYC